MGGSIHCELALYTFRLLTPLATDSFVSQGSAFSAEHRNFNAPSNERSLEASWVWDDMMVALKDQVHTRPSTVSFIASSLVVWEQWLKSLFCCCCCRLYLKSPCGCLGRTLLLSFCHCVLRRSSRDDQILVGVVHSMSRSQHQLCPYTARLGHRYRASPAVCVGRSEIELLLTAACHLFAADCRSAHSLPFLYS